MRRKVAFFFLTCSIFLVLGHSILPHNHLEVTHRACTISEENQISPDDILKLTVAHDLEANHLEENVDCNLLEFTPSDAQEALLKTESIGLSNIAFSSIIESFIVTNSSLSSQHYFLGSGLRAPPFLS